MLQRNRVMVPGVIFFELAWLGPLVLSVLPVRDGFWCHFELPRTMHKSYLLRAERSGETFETGFDNKNIFARIYQDSFSIKGLYLAHPSP